MEQSPDLFASKGENVTLQCSQLNTNYNGMYWFRQRPSESLELIVYYYANMGTLEDKFKQKVSAKKHSHSLDLTIKEVQSTDSAVYFCAKQDAQHDNLIFNLNKNCPSPTTNTSSTPVNCSTQTKYCAHDQNTQETDISRGGDVTSCHLGFISKCWFALCQEQETNQHHDSVLFISNHAGW